MNIRLIFVAVASLLIDFALGAVPLGKAHDFYFLHLGLIAFPGGARPRWGGLKRMTRIWQRSSESPA